MSDNSRGRRYTKALMSVLGICLPLTGPLCPEFVARAQESPSVGEETDAVRGLIEQGEYEGALTLLEETYAATPSPGLLFNIAMCNKALSRHAAAVKFFRQFLQDAAEADDDNKTMRRLAAEALTEELSFVTGLTLVDAPDGADISVDGVSIGSTPLTEPVYVLPGNHTVKVYKSGFSPMTLDVTAVGGADLSIRAELLSAVSHVLITCSVQNGIVTIDGEKCGSCPCEQDVSPGEHYIEIRAPGKIPAHRSISAELRHTTVLSVELEAAPVPPVEPVKEAPQNIARRKALKISGIVSATLGAAAIGVGGYCSYKQIGYATVANQESQGGNFDAYNRNNEDAKAWQTGLAVSYAIGATLVAAGLVLVLLPDKIEEKKHVVFFSPSGVGIRF